MGEAFQLLVEPEGGDGFPSSSDTAAGRVGFAHWRVVCGSPPEHILQLLPPLPLDISPGFPLSSVHGKFIFPSPNKNRSYQNNAQILLNQFSEVSHDDMIASSNFTYIGQITNLPQ